MPDDLADRIAGWRRALHAMPEPGYAETRTAAFVAETLRGIGVDRLETGVAGTGVVAVIAGGRGADGPARRILLRADMDALPIAEATGAPWASTTPGWMHACGHDGHVAMLLGGAAALAATRDFDGEAVLVFQPAEEFGAGARAMLDAGLLDRFPARMAFGMHNLPTLPVGAFALRPGPVMALADDFTITVTGRGGHAAMPSAARDPIAPAMALAQAVNALGARVDAHQPSVVGITVFTAGEASNVIPDVARLAGTIRAFSADVHRRIAAEIARLCAHLGPAHGVDMIFTPAPMVYPPVVNDAAATALARRALRAVAADAMVLEDLPPLMGAEDFAYIAGAVPSAFLFIGNGPSAPLHNAAYDFCDAAGPWGARLWRALVETALPPVDSHAIAPNARDD